jgi:DMSO/TMAO reductase YedYZ molybdopterin-dependent catalytic subunit
VARVDPAELSIPAHGGDRRVLSREPPNAEAGEGAFDHLVTPAALRFVRCHHPVPRLGDEHLLELSGAVAQPLRLSVADLRNFPHTTLTVVTECAGNGRTSIAPPVDGEPWHGGAVSTAQWTGVPLLSVLERVGVKETAVELVFTGADGGAYQRSLPRDAALDGSALLALEMNGEPIPPVFGGPLRLVVPGWYGMASVKWLARIEAVERPFEGPMQTEKYVYAPGVPVTRVRLKSMFTGLDGRVPASRPVRLTGLAWGAERIARVDVAIDGEWRQARLTGPLLPHAWRRFEFTWTPPAPGRYVVACRATDLSGAVQPERSEWNAGGYGANGIERVEVLAL